MADIQVLQGRTSLVTGASRGIGRAISIALARLGSKVIAQYHKDSEAASTLMLELPGSGHRIVQADLGDVHGARQLFEKVANECLDILVNNAGVYIEKPMLEMDFDEWQSVWEKTIGLNLTGPAHLSYLVSRKMVEQSGGRIINITSRGAFRGEPDALAYGASKAGLNSFGQSLAKALAPKNVLVFTVAPGFVETDMAREVLEGPRGEEIKAQSPLNRAAQPEEIANLVAYLASDAPAYMTGCIVDVNGASYLRS
ncbi:MAG: SDR family oxidoreductase [Bacteroidales bacterium]|nr:SDR family oxidoreductase [Bacteroidales bacterium]